MDATFKANLLRTAIDLITFVTGQMDTIEHMYFCFFHDSALLQGRWNPSLTLASTPDYRNAS